MIRSFVSSPLRRALVAWAVTSAMAPGFVRSGWRVDVLAALAWLFVLVAGAVRARALRAISAALAGGCLLGVWTADAHAYPALALVFASMIGVGLWIGPKPGIDARSAAIAVGIAIVPVLIAGLAWSVGDEQAHQLIRDDWRAPRLGFAALETFGAVQALVVAGWFALGARTQPRSSRVYVLAVAALVIAALSGARLDAILSAATLPSDAQWSESPALLNLLKLHVGAPYYGPFTDCNSYSYAPTLELIHHALLAPLDLDLSLRANRALVLLWQVVTTALLTAIVIPLVVRPSAPWRQRLFTSAFVGPAMLLVATSSFLANNVHPDHLLMPLFVLALGVTLHARRLPPRLVTLALVVLPAMCTAVKLTGAGVGVGLVLAFALPLEKRRIAALAAAAALSVMTLVAFDRLVPRFWQYTFVLQASHRVRWGEWGAALHESPARLLFAALLALAASFAFGERARDARREAGQAMLVTLGFAAPSLVAYLKVGGRVNSLLPVTIGSAVVLARLAGELVRSSGAAAPIGASLTLWSLLTITPPIAPVSAEGRARLVARHARDVRLIREEGAVGRRFLFYGETAPWLDAGRRDVPLDRMQSVSELLMGGHREAEAHFSRLSSGAYETLLIDDVALNARYTFYAPRLRAILAEHYTLDVAREEDVRPAVDDDFVPVRHVYRWAH